MPQRLPRTSCTASRQKLCGARCERRWRDARLIARGFGLVADFLPVAPGVRAERVRELRRPIDAAERDVVGELALRRIERGSMPDAFGNFMIGACRVAADAKAADSGLIAVERNTAAEGDRAAADLPFRLFRIGW